MTAPSRPVLRWHGGKWRLAPWIIRHMPRHRVYVEPFGGAASVLLRKPRSYAEVYNDLDADVVNLFRVLREPTQAALLGDALRLTPFARAEFELAYAPAEDGIERARRLIARSLMGFGSNAHACEARGHRSTSFRATSNRAGTTPAHAWASYPDALAAIVARLAGVVIERRDAWAVMEWHDGADTLHFVDPPYLPETRSSHHEHGYRHELETADHEVLLQRLRSLRGMVILCGYPSDLYGCALADWGRRECRAHADGARDRTEVLWLNPACERALGHGTLFDRVMA